MTPSRERETHKVVIVGAGFAGVGCARALAKKGVQVALLDRHNYHQFQPLLYQVATAQLAPSDVATPLRTEFRKEKSVDVKNVDVVAVDPATRTATTADGQGYSGDHLVLAMGSQPRFFRTPGAEEHAYPMYSLLNAQRLRSRLFELFEAADRNPSVIDQGALNFVIVGGGATGVEVAGALADLVNDVLPDAYRDLALEAAKIYLVDHGPALLGPFSKDAHDYAAKVLHRDGVRIKLGASVTDITADQVVFADGTHIPTKCAVWAGGVKAASLAEHCGLAQGRGGRIDVEHDLTVSGYPTVYALGDTANIPDSNGGAFPQLGSVALQSGQWAARNIVADIAGKPRQAFRYHDKGIMAMIGRGAAVAEVGAKHHELHGPIAFASWLGVHAWLMSGVRSRVDAFMSWGWDYFSGNRAPGLIDRPDEARIDWGEEADAAATAEALSDLPAPRSAAPAAAGPAGSAG